MEEVDWRNIVFMYTVLFVSDSTASFVLHDSCASLRNPRALAGV
jgi:hypothetical protein